MDTKTHSWTKAEIKRLLETNDKMVCKSLIKLYERQTDSEQSYKDTTERNNVGFNGIDANYLSSVAEFYNNTGFLTPKQIVFVRKKLLKYSGQLAKIANGEI